MTRAIPEVFPFARIDYGTGFPAWIRGLRRANGVYLFRDVETDELVYIGESHTSRLYATLTRHFQAWTNAYDTAGVTYDRDQVDVAVIIVPRDHATHLQNELICTLTPRDNRASCADIFPTHTEAVDELIEYDPTALDQYDHIEPIDTEETERHNAPPDDYSYDIPLLLEGITYEFPDDDALDVPF